MKSIQASFAKRALIAAMFAGAGLVASTTFAEPAAEAGGPGAAQKCQGHHAQKGEHKKLSAAERQEKRAKRLADLKQKLQITPAQESAWNAYTQTWTPHGQMKANLSPEDRQARREAFKKMTTPERLDMMLTMSQQRQERMAARAEATKAFYAALTPEQQAVFDAQPMKRGHRGHWGHGNKGMQT